MSNIFIKNGGVFQKQIALTRVALGGFWRGKPALLIAPHPLAPLPFLLGGGGVGWLAALPSLVRAPQFCC